MQKQVNVVNRHHMPKQKNSVEYMNSKENDTESQINYFLRMNLL